MHESVGNRTLGYLQSVVAKALNPVLEGNARMNRRDFAWSAAFAPLAMALTRSLAVAQAAITPNQSPAKPQRTPKTAAEYNKHPPVNEPEPFAFPLTFRRNEFKPRVLPFELSEVSLQDGPLSYARNW